MRRWSRRGRMISIRLRWLWWAIRRKVLSRRPLWRTIVRQPKPIDRWWLMLSRVVLPRQPRRRRLVLIPRLRWLNGRAIPARRYRRRPWWRELGRRRTLWRWRRRIEFLLQEALVTQILLLEFSRWSFVLIWTSTSLRVSKSWVMIRIVWAAVTI